MKTLFGPKPLRVRFDEVDGFIRVYNGTRYLPLFFPKISDVIYSRISQKSSITYVSSNTLEIMQVDS